MNPLSHKPTPHSLDPVVHPFEFKGGFFARFSHQGNPRIRILQNFPKTHFLLRVFRFLNNIFYYSTSNTYILDLQYIYVHITVNQQHYQKLLKCKSVRHPLIVHFRTKNNLEKTKNFCVVVSLLFFLRFSLTTKTAICILCETNDLLWHKVPLCWQ